MRRPRRKAALAYQPAFALLTFAAALIAMTVITIVSTPKARAEGRAAPPAAMNLGGLFVPANDGGTGVIPAPLLGAEIKVDVSGVVARTTVTHIFKNPAKVWTEAIYTHPLPEKSAVDELRMLAGGRVAEGVIKEKGEAKRIYAQARKSGNRASLAERQRPNIFTTALANLGPDETIRVEIGFQERLDFRDGAFRLNLPLVVGPRHIPGGDPLVNTNGSPFTGTGRAPNNSSVPDASEITPPLRPEEEGVGNPVTIEVTLDAGFRIGTLASSTHAVEISGVGTDHAVVTLKGEAAPAVKDFELIWTPEPMDSPQAGLFWEEIDGRRHGLLLVMPPRWAVFEKAPKPARDVIFIIDTSDSMQGSSMEQAKRALMLALDRLTPRDSFQIIRFGDQPQGFPPGPVRVDAASIAEAKAFVGALQANGGTEMVRAVDMALSSRKPEDGRLRQVVMITDGAIGGEDHLLRLIDLKLGNARLFTVGVGAAPNGYLMREAAQAGRGTFTFIPSGGDVPGRMEALFKKLERPALTDLTLAWPAGVKPSVWPNPLPDLYPGEPIAALMTLPRGADQVRIGGLFGGARWETKVTLKDGRANPGVAALWAREKVASLQNDMRRLHDQDWEIARREIIATSLRYSLVGAHTSLVAVDRAQGPPEGEKPVSKNVPTNLPEGWDRDAAAQEVSPRSAPPPNTQAFAPRHFDRYPEIFQTALKTGGVPLSSLPQGSTAAALFMLLGSLFVALAGVILWRASKREDS